MPGKRITKHQVKIFMKARSDKYTQEAAAAKAGFSERTARRVTSSSHPSSEQRDWKTRQDPFEGVWDSDILPLVQKHPKIQAKFILIELQTRYPEQFPDSQLRTLQRKIRHWKAVAGPEQEVMFLQEHPPGWQSLSDFTDGSKLGITIAGEPFDHLLYHFRVACSGWEYAKIIRGGESFTALAEGMQNALWQLGGITKTHRTDSLSAAYKNLSDKSEEEFTERYWELCAHYGMEPTRNNKGVSHENGSIEVSHFHLKSTIRQHLMLRQSTDFASVDIYSVFIADIIARHNKRVEKEVSKERPFLKPLPNQRTCDYDELSVKVTCTSIVRIKEVAYSVPSRLIGRTLKVHLFDDRLRLYLGADFVLECKRLRWSGGKRRLNQIDYRHIVQSLSRKPQAFRNYVFRDGLFPTLAFRQAWELLDRELDDRDSCKEYVAILKVAAEGNQEKRVNRYLEECLYKGKLPRSKEVQALFRRALTNPPSQDLEAPNLGKYESFFN